MIEDGLFLAIRNHAGCGTKLKDGSIYHIYPVFLPEGFKATNGYGLTYTEVGQQIKPEVRTVTYQINAFGESFEKARQLAADVEDCLNELRDTLLGGCFAITYAKLDSRQVVYDQQAKLWYFAIDITIKY